jgi:hypothetical protein
MSWITDPAFWERQYTAFQNAPVACLIFLTLGAAVAWWFRNTVSEGKVAGLRERVCLGRCIRSGAGLTGGCPDHHDILLRGSGREDEEMHDHR